jgi:hypothetical protein
MYFTEHFEVLDVNGILNVEYFIISMPSQILLQPLFASYNFFK